MSDAKGLTGRALGEAVLDHVLSFPEQHSQHSFVNGCNTTACIAGWACTLHYGVSLADVFKAVRGDARDVHDIAADLLCVERNEFEEAVFVEFDRDTAISNFKHLLDTSEL